MNMRQKENEQEKKDWTFKLGCNVSNDFLVLKKQQLLLVSITSGQTIDEDFMRMTPMTPKNTNPENKTGNSKKKQICVCRFLGDAFGNFSIELHSLHAVRKLK